MLRERAAVVRAWERELRSAALQPDDFATALAPLVDDLMRMVASATDPALVFAERLQGRGAMRWRQRARLRDVEREVGSLFPAIVRIWSRRRGEVPCDVVLLLGAISHEAVVRVSSDYARASEAAEAQSRLTGVQRALTQLTEVVMVLDRRGTVAMVAGPTEKLLGRAAGELIGQPGRGPALEALRSGREVAGERVRVRNAKTGQERLCETRAFPLFDGEIGAGARADVAPRLGARVVGAVELLRDVSRELAHDEELRRADRELTALHARLLRRAHGQAMAELATATASALNNELNAVSMSLSLVQKELPQPGELVARHLFAVEQAVQRSAALVTRLQQLAARQPNAPARAVSLNDLLMEALDLVRPELTTSVARKAVRVDARLGELSPVLAQPSELRELLCTLIIEARNAMAKGGVLQVTTRKERDGGTLSLTHPVGPETPRDPFATGLSSAGDDDAAASDLDDRGITLAAARDRARRWGGDLTVEIRGQRATIRLTLPPAPAPRATPSGSRPAVRPARRILVVDDDAGNRDTLSELLGLSGHEVITAESGKTALDATAHAERPFDVALVDLAMPDMNGLELARRLRASDRALRIALVTGWEVSAVDESGESGVIDAIFRKPIDLPAILRFLDGGGDSGKDLPSNAQPPSNGV